MSKFGAFAKQKFPVIEKTKFENSKQVALNFITIICMYEFEKWVESELSTFGRLVAEIYFK